MTKQIICIIGTTGVGKSQLSVYLSQLLGGEVINADSMQMYKGVPQITNKHPVNERNGVLHHVMDHTPWSEAYHIHKFENQCQEAINAIRLPVIVGGTHYYLQSVLFNNKTINVEDKKELTKEQIQLLESDNSQLIWDELHRLDPKVSVKFHPNDIRRVKRALELIYLSNEKTSDVYTRQRNEIASEGLLKYNVLFLWVYSKLDTLDTRLDNRVDKMFANGAIDELNELYAEYVKSRKDNVDLTSGVWQVIGFKEFLPYLETYGPINKSFEELKNDIKFNECLEEMKLRTRRYARRQIKWIKNQLIPEVQDESKVMILDATDLNDFRKNVEMRGLQIAREFQSGEIRTEQIPENLVGENLVKVEQKESKWEHHQCILCHNGQGEPLLLLGDQWEIHLKGRQHKRNIIREQKIKKYEEWLKAQNN